MYFLGGAQAGTGTHLSSCYVLDMQTQVWSALNNISFGTYANGNSVVVGTKIYCAGGAIAGMWTTGNFKCYNTETDTWSSLANTPISIYYHPTLCNVGNYIYLYVGWTPSGVAGSRLSYRYNITTNSWSAALATAPDSIYTSYATPIDDDNIRILGGIYPDGLKPEDNWGVKWNWGYKISTNQWDTTSYAPVPTPGGLSYHARFGDYVYLISRYGYNGPSVPALMSGTTEIYHIPSNTWVTGVSKPNAALNGVVGVYKGNIFCAGCEGTNRIVEIFSSFQSGNRVYATIIG
jgi:hypothetical protein